MFLLLFLPLFIEQSINDFLSLTPTQFRKLTSTQIINYMTQGSMGGYLSYDDVQALFTRIQIYSQITVSSIGTSFEGRNIQMIQISALKQSVNQYMIVGMVGGNQDLPALSLAFQQTFQLLLGLLNQDPYTLYLMMYTDIYIIPVLNIDTLAYLQQFYNNYISIQETNKSRRSFKGCQSHQYGVDLQRNFLYQFGQDNIGSSGNECKQKYRGTMPFSEPETQTLDQIIGLKGIDILVQLGGKIESLIIPDAMSNNYPQFIKQIADSYSIWPKQYSDVFINSSINGDLCSYYYFAYSIPCFTLNIGNTQMKAQINKYSKLIIVILYYNSPILSMNLYYNKTCETELSLCQTLRENDKGYLLVLSINNQGLVDYNGNVYVTVDIDQKGEQLYQIKYYTYSVDEKSYKNQQMNILTPLRQRSDTGLEYTISGLPSIQQQNSFKLILLFTISTGIYVPDVKNISVRIYLANSIVDNYLNYSLTIADFSQLEKYKDKMGFFPSRPESFIILILFGVISLFYLVVCLFRNFMNLVKQFKKPKIQLSSNQHEQFPINNGHNDMTEFQQEKQFDPSSRLNSQVKITQVAPSTTRMDLSGSQVHLQKIISE